MINSFKLKRLGVQFKPKYCSGRFKLIPCVLLCFGVFYLSIASFKREDTSEKVFLLRKRHSDVQLTIAGEQLTNHLDSQIHNAMDKDDDPVDVVYTWVNGSDPLLLQSMYETRQKIDRQLTIDKPRLIQQWSRLNRCNNKMPADKLRSDHYYLELPIAYIMDRSKVKDIISTWPSKGVIWNGSDNVAYFTIIDDLRDTMKLAPEGSIYPTFVKLSCDGQKMNSSNQVELETVFLSVLVWHSQPPKYFETNTNGTNNQSTLVGSLVNNSGYFEHVTTKSSLVKPDTIEPVELILANSAFYNFLSDSYARRPMLRRVGENDELKYSLRSLEKYAPWVRNVYIVTNGQIPFWLNTSNPRVRIVTHEQIFTNKSYLPTFNSNAIEAHIHRIPGLSRRYLYFNDDVQLAQPVSLEDFYTLDKGFKFYLVPWKVGVCAAKCRPAMINNGQCDKVCNSYPCFWDGDDCESEQSLQKDFEITAVSLPLPEDVYIASLEFTNRLLSEAFGLAVRRVPHHVPQFMDKNIVQHLQIRFANEYEATSSHQLRHYQDVSMAFLFANFVISQSLVSNVNATLEMFVKNSNGTLSAAELKEQISNAFGKLPLNQADVETLKIEMKRCETSAGLNETGHAAKRDIRKLCPKLVELIEQHYGMWKKDYRNEIVKDVSVAGYFKVQEKLDVVRRRLRQINSNKHYKFICFSDHLDYSLIETANLAKSLVHTFYDAKFPMASEFEL